MKEAMFYKKVRGKKVKCELCPRFCMILNGKWGFCGVRENRNGRLYSLVYGLPVSVAVDPIEKKPLFQFAPGTKTLSLATVGCNLRCKFCQNFEISQEYGEIYGNEMLPEEVIELARKYGVEGISYTYTEPTVFFEYALDIMKLAKKEGFYNMWVSNGYTNPGPVKLASKYLDAVNVDLKGNDEFYREMCGGIGIEPVQNSLKAYKENGVWIEVTNLIIPTYNDSEEEIAKLVEWVRDNLGKETPLHFSAFFPHYKVTDISPTPVSALENAVKIAKETGMKWVYAGNIYGNKYESTYCWKCGTPLIKRVGFSVHSVNEKCPKCKEKVDLRGMKWVR
ncbi:MAG: AmmeMemoRadiSam system radical SAM enzyme [Candidatus Aenigmatarchaeota archaeon]|nr:MAG: AmmeMemoRadiSam system radical SAM enzyme [Candidatus Aenigmarchaeota archaeon]